MTREELRQKYGTRAFEISMENARSIYNDLETAIDAQEELRAEIKRLESILADEDRKLRDQVAMHIWVHSGPWPTNPFDVADQFMTERAKRKQHE